MEKLLKGAELTQRSVYGDSFIINYKDKQTKYVKCLNKSGICFM